MVLMSDPGHNTRSTTPGAAPNGWQTPAAPPDGSSADQAISDAVFDGTQEPSPTLDLHNVTMLGRREHKAQPQALAANRVLPAEPLPQPVDVTATDMGLQKFRVLPHVPDDIGIAVFSEAEHHLNPITLMTLMNVNEKDNIPLFLEHVAWDNKYWKSFSPTVLAPADGHYAQAFVDRWNAMSPQFRSILQGLWG